MECILKTFLDLIILQFKNRAILTAEHLAYKHQLAVLQRTSKKTKIKYVGQNFLGIIISDLEKLAISSNHCTT